MTLSTRSFKGVAIACLIGGLVPTGTASAQDHVMSADDGTVLAEGFYEPQGVLVAPDGSVWVIEAGMGGDEEVEYIDTSTLEPVTANMGETARVVRIHEDGSTETVATLRSLALGDSGEVAGGGRLALLGDDLYGTVGHWVTGIEDGGPNPAAVVKIDGDDVTEIAETWTLERDENPDGASGETHPYGLAAGPDGQLWVADAGGNDLLRVDPETGDVEVIATFDALPGVFPNPFYDDEMLTDAVPTGVTFDEDGNAYVSLLSGGPFVPGAAKVVKVTPDGDVSDYATGLTMLSDLRTGPDGAMYAVQVAVFGEEGPTPDSGAIVRVAEGDGKSETVIEGLSAPTSIDFNADGDAYVTVNGGFSPPGSGAVVMYAGLAADQMAMADAESETEDADEAGSAAAGAAEAQDAAAPATMPQTGVGDGPVDVLVLVIVAFGLLAAAGLLLERRSNPAA